MSCTKGKHAAMHIAYHYRAKCHLKMGENKLAVLDNTEALKFVQPIVACSKIEMPKHHHHRYRLNGSFMSGYHDRAIAYEALGDTDLAAKDIEVYNTLLANLDNKS